MIPPVTSWHNGILVVRDDLLPGGTKARFIHHLFTGADELVYATPAEGGAQTAIAYTAQVLGKRATIFVAKRKQPHNRALMAKRLGATVYQVPHGYLSNVQAKAKAYCAKTGATLLPFGINVPEAADEIAKAAGLLDIVAPDEVWCASGSGVLARGLARAFPNAKRHVVQVGRALLPADVAGATIHVYPRTFGDVAKTKPPFPSDPHYDSKAWELCLALHKSKNVLFWNVTGPAQA